MNLRKEHIVNLKGEIPQNMKSYDIANESYVHNVSIRM